MYSYIDHMRAVQRYIKRGKRVGATIRQLGKPTKNALKDGDRKYERSHDLPAGYVRIKPCYSDGRIQPVVATPLNEVFMGRPADWMQNLTERGAMRSPGAPSLLNEIERLFWEKIATGITSERQRRPLAYHQR
ncbi:hypothetical protein C7534_14023 [Pseudomonas sp. OV226]|nr:hypothetical protein C7534_14023 [Pseudomonas sp. OV226]